MVPRPSTRPLCEVRTQRYESRLPRFLNPQDEDLTHSLRKLLRTTRGQVTVALEVGVLVCMLPFLVIDATMAGVYRQLWIDPWRILSTITYVNQVGGGAAACFPRALGGGQSVM